MSSTDIRHINIQEAKSLLPHIIEDVKNQRIPVLITQGGEPLVKIVPLDDNMPASRFGFMSKQSVPDDFNTLFTDKIQALLQGDQA